MKELPPCKDVYFLVFFKSIKFKAEHKWALGEEALVLAIGSVHKFCNTIRRGGG